MKVKKKLALLIAIVAILSSCANSKKKVEVELIRNATVKIEYAGQTFLVDPMLSPQKSWPTFKVLGSKELGNPTADLTQSVEEILRGVDNVLLTHHHIDHFDSVAIAALDKSIPIYAQPFDVDKLREEAFTNVIEVSNSIEVGAVAISRTGGVHGPADAVELLKRLGEVSGFVLQSEGYPTIYIVGDCLLDDEIRSNIRKFNPDIIITNSGGAVGMGSRILMNVEETAELAQFAPDATIIAVHLESIDHCPVTRAEIRNLAKNENLNILVPEDGEVMKF